jgi:glutamine cyclotransferase
MNIPVTYNGQPLSLLNEMEWIDGKLWANVYLTDKIVVIDPATGQVEGVLDFAGLLSESEMDSKTDVLNGIAYDEATGRIFITGKNWPKLFEIEVIK